MDEQGEATRGHKPEPVRLRPRATAGEDWSRLLAADWSRLFAEHRSRWLATDRFYLTGAVSDWIKDGVAGLAASVVLIANIVSFGALMFPGNLSSGIPTAVWAMLIGGCIGGGWIALRTSLPPLPPGLASPPGALLPLLSARGGPCRLAAGGRPQLCV